MMMMINRCIFIGFLGWFMLWIFILEIYETLKRFYLSRIAYFQRNYNKNNKNEINQFIPSIYENGVFDVTMSRIHFTTFEMYIVCVASIWTRLFPASRLKIYLNQHMNLNYYPLGNVYGKDLRSDLRFLNSGHTSPLLFLQRIIQSQEIIIQKQSART